MKKKNNTIEIIFIIILLLLSFDIIMKEQLGNLDEIWQYNFARNILNNKIPYLEFNIIVTPLYSIIASIFLKVFGNELIVMRIFCAILFFLILYVSYLILKKMNLKREVAFVITLMIYAMFDNGIIGVEYNYLVLFLVLLIEYLEIIAQKKHEKQLITNKSYNIFIGILGGLIILTKQSIGILIFIAIIFTRFIYFERKNLINIIKTIFAIILGVSIPIIIFILYLLINGAFNSFISYCITGINEFTNSVAYYNLIKNEHIHIKVLSVLVPIFLIVFPICWLLTNRNKLANQKKLLIILYIYSAFMFCGMFPGVNAGHFIVYAYPTILLIMIVLYKSMINEIKKYKKYINILVIYILLISSSSLLIIETKKVINIYNEYQTYSLTHYKYIPINTNIEKLIDIIDLYINSEEKNGYQIYILDASASMYMIPIDKYNKDYDLFNRGNFGYNGEKRLIKEIEERKKTKYLILKDSYKMNWQTPTNIINYVKNNKNKIGKIGIFDIYE